MSAMLASHQISQKLYECVFDLFLVSLNTLQCCFQKTKVYFLIRNRKKNQSLFCFSLCQKIYKSRQYDFFTYIIFYTLHIA